MTADFFQAPRAGSPIKGEIRIPGSKSLTNREIFLSALAQGVSVLKKPLISRDSELMLNAIRQFGSEVEINHDEISISPATFQSEAEIHCGLAGTVMRFVLLMRSLNNQKTVFLADKEANSRPLDAIFDALGQLGVEYQKSSDNFPFTMNPTGFVETNKVIIDASKSSQFVSALMLVAASFENGLVITHQGSSLPSLPHIEMTIDSLNKRGVQVESLSESSWRIPNSPIRAREMVIEPDLSNAGPFLAAVMVAGGELEILDWPETTTQVGSQYLKLLGSMGAEFEKTATGMHIKSDGKIRGIDADLSEAGELTPTIAALAALADSPSKLSGIAHLRGHETDRLKALSSEINRIGGDCEETDDGLILNPKKLTGGQWFSYHDHRMATAGTIIGLAVDVEIENIQTTAKTMPNFEKLWMETIA